jgi:hypothetical protein
MSFNRELFQGGVGSRQVPVLDRIHLSVPALEITKSDTEESIQRVRAGRQDVFNPLSGEQQVTSEYLSIPSVLSIRRRGEILAATDNFILGSFNEPDQEKMSFVFTFGDPTLFGGMGRRPRIFTYSGFLKDSSRGGSLSGEDRLSRRSKGISGWRKMYERYLRGSKCRASGAIADFRFRDQWRLGYVVAASMSYEETRPRVAPFSFSIFIIESIP